jgi:hydroxymethylpyrimidine kinase/phosphomethylpyrimidine kinase/thiamine-phosphate diphosphorylase
MSDKPAIAWTIAGSDSGGGAGIQADLHTFRDFGVHGCSVITALTAQNSKTVTDVAVTPIRNLRAQLAALADDLPAPALKLGMLGDADVVAAVCDFLDGYDGHVVCDPVMVSTTGASLLDGAGGKLLREKLLPRATVITPNLAEAAALLGRPVETAEQMEQAARDLVALGARSVLVKGGHLPGQLSGDFWSDGENSFWLTGERIDTIHTHGTGCTLSAAIAASLARGFELADALVLAKMYVTAGLRAAVQLGAGPGPVAHTGYPRRLADLPMLRRGHGVVAEAFPDCGGELGLYPVMPTAEWVERVLALGVTTVQLRSKHLSPEQTEAEIVRAIAASRRHGARLFINDHWQLAIRHGAYGVHLGQEDLDTADVEAIRRAGLRLGVSTHAWYEIARAHALRPSYIAIGPIFPTTTKVMKFSSRGLDRLREWVGLLRPDYTLTAIGGIGREQLPQVLETGVGSVALVTAITEAADWQAATRELLRLHAGA